MPEKSDLPQGTLDLLILKVVALGPSTAMRSRSACNRSRAMSSRCRKGRCTPPCTAWKIAACSLPIGKRPRPGARRSFIA